MPSKIQTVPVQHIATDIQMSLDWYMFSSDVQIENKCLNSIWTNNDTVVLNKLYIIAC